MLFSGASQPPVKSGRLMGTPVSNISPFLQIAKLKHFISWIRIIYKSIIVLPYKSNPLIGLHKVTLSYSYTNK